jgi:hypothetical protein
MLGFSANVELPAVLTSVRLLSLVALGPQSLGHALGLMQMLEGDLPETRRVDVWWW